jgi:hypothetical protein
LTLGIVNDLLLATELRGQPVDWTLLEQMDEMRASPTSLRRGGIDDGGANVAKL